VPLFTGPLAGANFGVVVAFRLPGACVEVELLVDAAALEALELDEEPQPLSASSAAHTAAAGRQLFIG
jgi:hypothetical protein